MSVAAFFDVDGTIVQGNIVSYYARIRTAPMGSVARIGWIATFLPRVALYILVDRFSRRRLNEIFYRNYKGYIPDELELAAKELARLHLIPHILPAARARIRWHQERNHEVVFVSGSIRQILDPLAKELAVSQVFCADLVERGGIFTGELRGGPLTDQRKADVTRQYASRRDIDLSHCYSYADSLDDLPMLECVGKPAAVNPEGKLRRIAQNRGWAIHDWRRR